MSERFWWISGCALSAAVLGLLWGTTVPLGIPGEWTWERLPADPLTGVNLLMGAIAALAYAAFARAGRRRLATEGVSLSELMAWLAGLVVAGAGWLWMVQETSPPAGQFAKIPFILYYPASSGYFHEVRYNDTGVGEFLARYESLMEQGDVLHVGTHPPGLFLVFYGLRELQQVAPQATAWLTSLAPASFHEAMAIVGENSAKTPHPTTPADAEVLWLAGVLVWLCGALTVLPLYGLLSWSLPRQSAWMAAAFWPTIPAVAIFAPKSDAAYPFLSCVFVLLTAGAWRSRSWVMAFLAGLVLWLVLMCSLAFLPVCVFLGLFLAANSIHQSGWRLPGQRWWFCAVALLAGFLLPVGAMWWLADINLFNVWRWNYQNHAGFYDRYPRTGWAWTLLNPLELLVAVGPPLAVLGLRNCGRLRWAALRGDSIAFAAAITTAALLWLSGKNSGEAGRLWLLFYPAMIWIAAVRLWPVSAPTETPSRAPQATAAAPLDSFAWLLLQLAVSLAIVHRVGGFHFNVA